MPLFNCGAAISAHPTVRQQNVIVRPAPLPARPRVNLARLRVPHANMGELRGVFNRLAVGTVPSEEMEKYRLSLCGRIAHIGLIHNRDVAQIKRCAAKSSLQLATQSHALLRLSGR